MQGQIRKGIADRTCRPLTLLSAAAIALLGAPGAQAAGPCDADRQTLERYPCLQQAQALSLDPLGRYAAVRHDHIDAANGYANASQLRIVSTKGGTGIALGLGSDPAWSPGGDRLLFVQRTRDATLLMLAEPDGQRPQQLARIDGKALSPTWSPDGRQILVAVPRPAPPTPLYSLPQAIAAVSRSAEPFETEQLHHQLDGMGYVRDGAVDLVLVHLDGTQRTLATVNGRVGWSDSNLPLKEPVFSWTPDGRAIFFDGNLEADRDMAANTNRLYRVDAASGAVSPMLHKVPGYSQVSFWEPTVSPDGKQLAFMGIATNDRFIALPAEMWVADIDGSNPRQLTRLDASDPDRPIWTADSRQILFSLFNRGNSNLYSVTPQGKLQTLYRAQDGIKLKAQGEANGAVLVNIEGFGRPADVATLTLSGSRLRPVTSIGADSVKDVDFGAIRRLTYRSKGGVDVTAWLLLPSESRAGARVPLIVRPDAGVSFHEEVETYRGEGYAVLIPHPRASQGGTGFGAAFMNHMRNGWYTDELAEDHLLGVDAAVATGLIDPGRLFVAGSSMGGSIAAFLITRTDRFKAASVYRPAMINAAASSLYVDEVALARTALPLSYWDDEDHLFGESLLSRVPSIKTPTLLSVGELDIRTPPAETMQLYTALKLFGHAPTRLIRLPGVAHGWGNDAATFLRLTGSTLGWFRRWDTPAR